MFALLGLVMGCSPAVPGAAEEPFSADFPGAYVYRCEGDRRVLVRMVEDSARLQLDLFTATLPPVEAASGARYAAGGVTFWSHGAEATFELPDERLADCRGSRAETPWEASRLLGYDRRGVGQEPGWMVEVDLDRRMHVLADYGEVEFFTARPAGSSPARGETVYRAASGEGEVVATFQERPCEDVMSGEPFPLTVTLRFGGRELSGCGRTTDEDVKRGQY